MKWNMGLIKNKRGSTIFILLMMGVVFFWMGLALAKPLGDVVTENTTNSVLDCGNSSISNQAKAVCTSIEAIQPFFIGLVFGLAGLLLGGVLIR